MALPPPNPFIPDSLAVLPNGKSAKLPYEVRMTVVGTRLWYKQDDTFRVPKLNARCAVQLQLAAPRKRASAVADAAAAMAPLAIC